MRLGDSIRGARLVLLTVVIVLGAVLTAPTIAFAQDDPTREQYGDELANITKNVGGGGGGGEPGGRVVSSLPFTGLDLIGLVSISVAFVSTGLLLRRTRAFGASPS